MTAEEITKGNYLIGCWMLPAVHPIHIADKVAGGHDHHAYHKRWELLMPVIIKLSEQHLGWSVNDVYHKFDDCLYPRTFGMRDENGHYMFRFNNHQLFTHESLITAAWMAVVDCINSLPKTEK